MAPPQPPPAPPEVEAIAEVRIKPGDVARVPIAIKRNNNHGIIEITAGTIAGGISVQGVSIPAGTSRSELVVKAAESLGDQELAADVPLTGVVNGVSFTATFKVIVPQYELPEFSVNEGVILVPGATREVALRCDRKGYPGPIELKIGQAAAGLPEGVSCSVESLEANDDSAALQITLADEVADGTVTIPLALAVRQQTATKDLSLTIARYPHRVGAVPAVTLAPGESRRLTLPIERNGYEGPLEIEAVNPPAGMTLSPGTVTAGANSVNVEIGCAADAADKVATLTLRSSGGDITIDSPLVVRVTSGDDRSLPAAVLAVPKASGLLRKGSYAGRLTPESKQALRDLYGGSAESDAAVMRGLAWLARTQQPDGGWMLAGGADATQVRGGQPVEENRIAATALALLPFLAEGITHKSAPETPRMLAGYKPVVEKGLVFLATNQNQARGPGNGSWNTGIQAQALATIALCEAYAISRDKKVRSHAHSAAKFLVDAQDPGSGGWRNAEKEGIELSATVWAIMALRAAQLANLPVKARDLEAADNFVRLCAAGSEDSLESQYARGPGRDAEPGLTAAALLARLCLGWDRDQPQLLSGRDYLMANLPPVDKAPLGDLLLFHFATQVLQQLEGVEFDTWNGRLREHLIRTQNVKGDLAGSWDPQGAEDVERGGRMYATALSLLTLQTYYRHLPLFREIPKKGPGEPQSEAAADESAADGDDE
ncbi:MAG: hypothetical protein ACKOCX_02730 [Planctomycetota bacterium]